jgi:hypothetical protein
MELFRIIFSHLKLNLWQENERQDHLTSSRPSPSQPREHGYSQSLRPFRLSRSGYQVSHPARTSTNLTTCAYHHRRGRGRLTL